MNNKSTIIAIISIVLFGGILFIAKPRPQDVKTDNLIASNGVLSSEEKNFDFGTISMAKGNVSHSFKIKNENKEPMTIEKIYTSCMCTTASLVKNGKIFGPYGMPGHGFIPKINETINSGEEAEIEAVFDPTAHGPAGVGKIQRTIIIENNAGQPLELQFSALVTP